MNDSEPERLFALVGDIYDAALDPVRWPKALEGARDFIGGQVASIYWHDSARPIGNSFVQIGLSPEWERAYFETYLPLNPMLPFQVFCPVEEIHSGSELMSFDEFSTTRFYKEWAAPQGLVDATFSNLERLPTSSVAFSVLRGEVHGLVDNEARRRMKLIVPHIRRAALISGTFESNRSESVIFSEMLNAINSAVFIVDAAGRVILANMSGYAMAERGPIRIAGGVIGADDAYENNALREAITLASNGDRALGTRGISLSLRTETSEQYVGRVLSLCSGQRSTTGAKSGATATIFIRRASLDVQSAGNVIRQTYRLTPTELRVLLGIVEIGGIPEVASALGMAEETVKTHLKRVFNKTDTRRQADLVKLVCGFADPL